MEIKYIWSVEDIKPGDCVVPADTAMVNHNVRRQSRMIVEINEANVAARYYLVILGVGKNAAMLSKGIPHDMRATKVGVAKFLTEQNYRRLTSDERKQFMGAACL